MMAKKNVLPCFIYLSSADDKQNKRSRVYYPKIQNFSNCRLEIMSTLRIIMLCRRQDTTEGLNSTSSKYKNLATSRLSRSAAIRVHVEVRNR